MKWDTDYYEQWRRCGQGSGWRIRIGSDCDGGNNLNQSINFNMRNDATDNSNYIFDNLWAYEMRKR
jgi:hypothetical protein